MEDDDGMDRKLPRCLWGDGCLLRLSDQKHAESYTHTTSPIKKCPIEDCPLYQKAYDFVIGPPIKPTPEIKKAQQHAALHYHPPIRSRSVARTRPKSNQKHKRHSLDPKSSMPSPGASPSLSVPKLNLDDISRLSPSRAPQIINSAPDLKSEFSPIHPIRPKSSSDPSRPPNISPKTITVSPKKRSSSINSGRLDSIAAELEELKSDVAKDRASANIVLKGIQQDVTFIKELLLNAMNDGGDTTRYYSSDEG